MRVAVNSAGFTLLELVGTMVIVGLLAVVALPRLGGERAIEQSAFQDQVAAALRFAQKTAVARRRLVCAQIQADRVTLSIAASNPAVSCNIALAGADGNADWARASSASITGGTGVIHFQPSGVVTTTAGAVSNFSIAIAGTSGVTVTGTTGHVR